MLYVITCADFAAVGPGVLNSWKIDVLTGVYNRLLDILSGGKPSADFQARVAPLRQELAASVVGDPDEQWYQTAIASLPHAYLDGARTDHLLEDLRRIKDLPPTGAVAWGRYLPERDVVEFSIGGRYTVDCGRYS